MITNIRQSEDKICLSVLGHTDVIERPKAQFYTLVLVENKKDPLQEQENLERTKLMYEAHSIERLSKTKVMLTSPGRGAEYMSLVNSDFLWPYSTLVTNAAKIQTSFSNETCKWTVGELTPRVLMWGLVMNYEPPRPSIRGMYYGTNLNGKLSMEIYDAETMCSGVVEFLSAAKNADIILTSSHHMEKLTSLKIWSDEHDVGFDTSVFKQPLLTTLQELFRAEIPSLNWDYPKQIHAWALRQNLTTLKASLLQYWQCDYVRSIPQLLTDISTIEIYSRRLSFWDAIGKYLLFKRTELALESRLDLRTVLNISEMTNYTSHVYTTSMRTASPCVVLASSLCETLENLADVAIPQLSRLYVYDVKDVCWKVCPPERGTRRVVVDTFVRSMEFVERLKDLDGSIGLFESGYVTFYKIDGIDPIFTGTSALVSLSGIVIYNENEGFGYGVQGSEKITTRLFDLRATECLKDQSRTDAPARVEDVSYNVLVHAKNYHLYRNICTPIESEAIVQKSFCVPCVLWKSKDGKYVSDSTTNISSRYIGPGLPSATESSLSSRSAGMRWE